MSIYNKYKMDKNIQKEDIVKDSNVLVDNIKSKDENELRENKIEDKEKPKRTWRFGAGNKLEQPILQTSKSEKKEKIIYDIDKNIPDDQKIEEKKLRPLA